MSSKPESALKVIIADSYPFFRDGFHSALKKIRLINKITHASDGAELLQVLEKEFHHIVFIDVKIPVINGIEAAKKIKRNFPDVKVVALCTHDDMRGIVEMINYGAAGCILKNTNKFEIERVITDVVSGKNYFSPNLSGEVFQKLISKHRQHILADDILTLREKEILGLICKQQTTGEISETLFISVKTVETHRGELLQKTKSKNVAGLVLWAIRNGYCEEL